MSPPLGSSQDLNPNSRTSLLDAVATSKGIQKVVSLRDDDAEAALTLLQKELDDPGSQCGPKFRARLSGVILCLVKRSHKFPAHLWLSDVQEGVEVARGAYGTVYKGSLKGKGVALKFPHRRDDFIKNGLKKFFHEVLIWRQLSHENVLPFLGLYRSGPRNLEAMVAPWQSGGNLVEFIREYMEVDRYKLLIQITNGLTYLHELNPPIVHSDLKPENILISAEKTAVLADFGLSQMQNDLTELLLSDHLGVKGTLPYCAPELFEETTSPCKPSTSQDIWALGMVIYRVFTGKVPFKEYTYPKGICDAITSGKIPGPRHYRARQCGFTDELCEFLENDCWNMRKEERPSTRDCGHRLKGLRSRWQDEKTAKLALPYQHLVEVIDVPKSNYCRTLFERRKPYLYSLIEQFGVRIAKETYGKIKVWGDKIYVEEAIIDIYRDYENFTAPRKSASLSVPSRLQGFIIGRSGESVKALEQEYSVEIKFKFDEQVNVIGPPDNVEKATASLQSIVDYILLYGDIRELPVNQKLIARLRFPGYLQMTSAGLGLQGLPRINKTNTSISIRGPKEALKKAKTHFCRLQEELDRETTLILKGNVDQLRPLVTGPAWPDIVLNCGGPSNPILQKAIVTLRQEDNEVLLRGDEELINRLKDHLLVEVEKKREIVLGMVIPQNLHHDLRREYHNDIKEIQKKAGVYISFFGQQFYDNLGEPENILEDGLFEADGNNIVKIQGNLGACKTAQQMLKELVEKEERVRRTVTFKAKYFPEVQNLVMGRLKRMGIKIQYSSTLPAAASPDIISLAPLPEKSWILWGLIRRFDLLDREECALSMRAMREKLDEGSKILTKAVHQVSAASYEGRLQFSASTRFGRLIGTNGVTIQRLETETNTKIKLIKADKDHSVINIIGSKKNVKEARDKIIRLLDSDWISVGNVTPQ